MSFFFFFPFPLCLSWLPGSQNYLFAPSSFSTHLSHLFSGLAVQDFKINKNLVLLWLTLTIAVAPRRAGNQSQSINVIPLKYLAGTFFFFFLTLLQKFPLQDHAKCLWRLIRHVMNPWFPQSCNKCALLTILQTSLLAGEWDRAGVALPLAEGRCSTQVANPILVLKWFPPALGCYKDHE